jgi:uncharacterized RDD family membrane protein YckC
MNDNVESYIQKIDYWLPYQRKKKTSILKNVRVEVNEAIEDTGNSDPILAYGDPYQIAKALSLSQDWDTKVAGWGVRTLAFIIDVILIVSACLIYLLFGLVVLFRIDLTRVLRIRILSEAFDILRSELELGTFLILAVGLLFYVLGAAVIYSLYFIGLEKIYSTTIGKKLLRLLVIDESGVRLTWKQSIIRNFTKLPGIIEFLPFDTILGMLLVERGKEDYQRATDILAKTVVVRSI